MNKYYIFMKKESSQVFKRDESNKLEKMSHNGIDVFNNTLKYDFKTEEIVAAFEDKYYTQNRYAIIGPNSLCCGINVDLPTKLCIYLLDLFKLLNIDSGEVVIVLEEDATVLFYSNNLDINKVFELVFSAIKKSYKISYKGALIQNNIITGLQRYLLHKYKNGTGFIDDLFLSAVFKRDKKRVATGNGYWGLYDLNNKRENDEKFYRYLETEGISKRHENIENIKNYVYNESLTKTKVDSLNLIIKDEEYNLDFKIINEYVDKIIEDNLTRLKELLPDKCNPDTKIKFFMSIKNNKTKEKVIEIFNDKNFEIASQEEYNDLVDKVMIYIDYVIKYNTILHKKKIFQLLNSKRRHEIEVRLNYSDGIAYSFDLYISQKEDDEVFKKLNIKKMNL